MICDAVFENKIPDATIVPITINYEKVLEGDTYPYELLGDEKVKESLGRVLKAIKTFGQNYGRIFIEICNPISITNYTQNFLKKNSSQDLAISKKGDRKKIVQELGYDIVISLT
jgi:glycerol-3-phosphate O-acyltransferase